MEIIKSFLSEHRYAILTAVIVACIAGFPQIIAKNMLGDAYHGIPYLTDGDSESEYLARIHEILDGHISVSSPMLYEYKDSVTLMPPTGEMLFYVLPMKLLGISLYSMVFLSKFLYPTLLFLFAYLFILSLLNREDTGARLSAIAGAFFIITGYDAISPGNFISYLAHGDISPTVLLWNRLVHPITGAILLFAFLWLLARIVKEKGRWPAVLISGLILAAMSGYIFSFALGLTISVLVGLYFMWRKNWPIVTKVCTSVAIAILINAFYFINVLRALNGKITLGDPRKAGMFFTHVPMLNVISYGVLAMAVILFAIYFRKDESSEQEKRWWLFSLAVAVACVIVYGQQLITGRTIWPQHFVQYTKPLAVVIITVFLHNLIRPHAKNLWRAGVVVLLAVSVLYGWRILATVRYTVPADAYLQSFSGVMGYLNKNAPKDCVVYVSSDPFDQAMNRFIPALTSCNDYHTYYLYSGVPAERIMDNYLIELRLNNLKVKDVAAYYNKDRFYTTSYFFRDWNDMMCCKSDRWLPQIADQAEIDRWFIATEKQVEQNYAEFLKKDLYSELTKYRLDYFVVDTTKQPRVNDKTYPFLSLKGKFGKFAVYAVAQPQS